MSTPENIIYNVNVVGNLSVTFDEEESTQIPLAKFEGDVEIGKSSRVGNITIHTDSGISTFSQEKLTYISGVTSNIQTQLDSIAINISNNVSNITNNASNISTNTTNIANNASNIATNITNIATNATNIATNITNIATNASDIADLTTQVNDFTFRVTTLTADTTLSFPLANNFFIINTDSQITITLPSLNNSDNIGKVIYFKNICNKTATIKVASNSNKIYSSGYNDLTDNTTNNDNDAENTSYVLRRTKLAVFYCVGSDAWCV